MLSVLKGLLDLGATLVQAAIRVPQNKLRALYVKYRVNRAIKRNK